MFNYEIRNSSSDFCKALFIYEVKDLNFNSLPNSENAISKKIENQSWFFLSWKNDPTIYSMLVMLDLIHETFIGKKTYFEKLLNNDNPVITFQFMELDKFNLTDDLYIKMNSRGKPLSPYENFKANFEKYLSNFNNKEQSYDFILSNNEANRTISKYFIHMLDTKWADIFWKYKSLINTSTNSMKNDDMDFDDEIMNFIRIIITNCYIENKNTKFVKDSNESKTLNFLIGSKNLNIDQEELNMISFYKYNEFKIFVSDKEKKDTEENLNSSISTIKKLISSFECLIIDKSTNKINKYMSDNYAYYYNENLVFENALKHQFDNLNQRVSFYAYMNFLRFFRFKLINLDSYNINQWMRVIHNLTHPDNRPLDSIEDLTKAINAISAISKQLEKSKYNYDILKYLKDENSKIHFFPDYQIKEERIKANLILKNNVWKEEILKVEQHNYFHGQIGFILEFSGIIEYYDSNNHFNWSDEENILYFEKFKNYSKIACHIFSKSYENRINDNNYIFERAVLTKGNYLLKKSNQNVYNLLTTNLVKNNIKRDYSWFRLLRLNDETETKNRRRLVKSVFDDIINSNSNDIGKALIYIINNSDNSDISYWRKKFINNPILMAYCKQGFILFENENEITLYHESRSCHMHAELYSYSLWKTKIQPNIESNPKYYSPFNAVNYIQVKSIEALPSIKFQDCKIGDKNYILEIIYVGFNNKYNKKYNVKITEFEKIDIIEDSGDYNEKIKEVLEKYSFGWDIEEKCYSKENNSDEVINTIKEICLILNNLQKDM